MASRLKTKATKPRAKTEKPSRMKRDKVTFVKMKKEPEIPDTREDLMLQIGLLLDKVDEKMAGKRNSAVTFSRYGSNGLLRDECESGFKLVHRLNKLVNPTESYDVASAIDLIQETFGATPGTVPPWSRPGTFLVWIDYVACRCIWGGFLNPEMEVVAADPKAPWITPSGAISARSQIYDNHKTPLDVFRESLTESTRAVSFANTRRRTYASKGEPAFNLHPLGELARAAAEGVLALPEHAWLVAALKRGPVDPIPLPAHLQTVQTSLFS